MGLVTMVTSHPRTKQHHLCLGSEKPKCKVYLIDLQCCYEHLCRLVALISDDRDERESVCIQQTRPCFDHLSVHPPLSPFSHIAESSRLKTPCNDFLGKFLKISSVSSSIPTLKEFVLHASVKQSAIWGQSRCVVMV